MKKLLLLLIVLFSVNFSQAQVMQTEKDALMSLYNSTNGTSWNHQDNWTTTQPVSAWHGVTVVNINGQDHVTGLDLNTNNLSGVIPNEFGDLTYLEAVNLEHNLLTGAIPTLISSCVNLRDLFLDFNQLSGDIPNAFGSMPNLRYVGLRDNLLTGELILTENANVRGIWTAVTQVSSIDLRNGNNQNINYFYVDSNPNLICIFVDDVNAPNSWSYVIMDPTAHFVETQAACDALSMPTFNAELIQIFPNPTTGTIHIYNKEITIDKILLLNTLGQILRELPNKDSFQVNYLKKGVYFIKIRSADGKFGVYKMLKE